MRFRHCSMETYTEASKKFIELLPRLISQSFDRDLRLREHTLMVRSSCGFDVKVAFATCHLSRNSQL